MAETPPNPTAASGLEHLMQRILLYAHTNPQPNFSFDEIYEFLAHSQVARLEKQTPSAVEVANAVEMAQDKDLLNYADGFYNLTAQGVRRASQESNPVGDRHSPGKDGPFSLAL